MTDTTTEAPDDVLVLPGAEKRDRSGDHVPFQLEDDDYVYHAHRPKMSILLNMAKVLAGTDNSLAQAGAFDDLLEQFLDTDSLDYIRGRLNAPEDDLDLDSPAIIGMFQALVGRWYGRPTGKPRGSRGSSGTTQTRSTAL